jgi:phosphinothricin acetyltransferase
MTDEATGGATAGIRIRLADADADGAGAADVYRPAVEASAASFELEPPTPEEMADRIRRTLAQTPWLVAVDAGRIVGYAYAGPHHERAAYRWSVNVSAYVHPGWHRQGIGRSLYRVLFEALRTQRFVNVYAGITTPNDASLALHRSFGMEPIGVYRDVGYKSGQWHDVAWFGMRLREPSDPPDEPIPLPDLLLTPAGEAWLARMAEPIAQPPAPTGPVGGS